jgi:serine/threonine protein kinase
MSTHSSLTSSGLPSPPRSPPKGRQNLYVEGTKYTAKRHEPPTTFEMGYWTGCRPVLEVPGGSSQLDWCLANPPAPGITHEADEQSIEISSTIRIGEGYGAQLILTTDGLVAKIYDPLYYKFQEHSDSNEKINVTDSADRDYITEVAAYSEFLGTPIAGSITPIYYGSWTLSIPYQSDGEEEFREVRLILIEYVSGTSMLDVDPSTLSERERENVMTKLIEADVALRFAGVSHEDLEPRNVMLSMQATSKDFADKNLRICIIDFACCWFPKDEYGGDGRPPDRMHNPLHYWAGQSWYSGWGWLPPREEAVEWMWKTWGNGGEEGKYVVVERDPKSRLGKPKRIVS